MSFERWNTHFSTLVEQEVFGVDFKLAQDPNSHNLGTTVWDASIVLAKFLEKNAKRGDLSRVRAKGRRCLELGSGMGLGGLAFALLGADVTLSDLAPVLPLLERNYHANLAPAVLRVGDSPWAAEVVGRVAVQELDWSCPAHYATFTPPYDYVLAADCVYSELAVPHFLATVLHMCDTRSTVVVVNEFRSQSVHNTFMEAFQPHFTLKKVPPSKMDPHYQHPLIHIYICKRRKTPLQDPPPAPAPAPVPTSSSALFSNGTHSCAQSAPFLPEPSAPSNDSEGTPCTAAGTPSTVTPLPLSCSCGTPERGGLQPAPDPPNPHSTTVPAPPATSAAENPTAGCSLGPAEERPQLGMPGSAVTAQPGMAGSAGTAQRGECCPAGSCGGPHGASEGLGPGAVLGQEWSPAGVQRGADPEQSRLAGGPASAVQGTQEAVHLMGQLRVQGPGGGEGGGVPAF